MPGVFDLANIEPSESFEELCDRRAKQLRKKYDKIVLSFSGGTDSFTVYNSFVRNNLLIDDIVCTYMDVDCGASKDNATWIKQHHTDPRTTFHIFENNKDIPPNTFETDDWVFAETPPLYKYRRTFPAGLDFIKTALEEKYKTNNYAIVTGYEKPGVILKNNQWHMSFVDKPYQFIMGHEHIEMFYISAEVPQLHIKQCHMFIRFLEAQFKNVVFTREHNPYGTTDMQGVTHFAHASDYGIDYTVWAEASGRKGEAVVGNSALQKKFNKISLSINNNKDSIMNLEFNNNPNIALFTEHLLDKTASAINFANGLRNLHSNNALYNYLLNHQLLPDANTSILNVCGLASSPIWIKDKNV